MRDPIEHTIVDSGKAEIGSNTTRPRGKSSAKIPPRSFLGGTTARKESEVRELMGRHVVGAIEGKKAIGP
jgi:hypothetical protein